MSDEDPPRSAAKRDLGMSLVEVLVAVVLLGLGGVATMAALGGAISGSSIHETKIVGLSVLETAAAAIPDTLDDCSAYQDTARAAIPADGWDPGGLGSPSALTVTADCSNPDLHWIELRYDPPNGRGAGVLSFAVGGPNVIPPASEGGDEIQPILGDTTCRVTSIASDPPSMVWYFNPLPPPGTITEQLDQDVTITATKTGNCAGIRAVIEPNDSGEVLHLPLNSVDGAPSLVRAVASGREIGSQWNPGLITTRFEHEMTADVWTSMQAGAVFTLFVVDECVLGSADLDIGTMALDETDRLIGDVTLTASVTGACDDVTLDLDTGTTVLSLTTSTVAGNMNAVIEGAPGGATWTSGAKELELSKPRASGTSEILATLGLTVEETALEPEVGP